jgi:nucleoside diphosphate kinase
MNLENALIDIKSKYKEKTLDLSTSQILGLLKISTSVNAAGKKEYVAFKSVIEDIDLFQDVKYILKNQQSIENILRKAKTLGVTDTQAKYFLKIVADFYEIKNDIKVKSPISKTVKKENKLKVQTKKIVKPINNDQDLKVDIRSDYKINKPNKVIKAKAKYKSPKVDLNILKERNKYSQSFKVLKYIFLILTGFTFLEIIFDFDIFDSSLFIISLLNIPILFFLLNYARKSETRTEKTFETLNWMTLYFFLMILLNFDVLIVITFFLGLAFVVIMSLNLFGQPTALKKLDYAVISFALINFSFATVSFTDETTGYSLVFSLILNFVFVVYALFSGLKYIIRSERESLYLFYSGLCFLIMFIVNIIYLF